MFLELAKNINSIVTPNIYNGLMLKITNDLIIFSQQLIVK